MAIRQTRFLTVVITGLMLASCSRLLGLDEFRPGEAGGSGGIGHAGGASGAAGTGSGGVAGEGGSVAGSSASSGTGGTSAAGGTSGGTAGGGGAQLCEPNTTQGCYSGPTGTQGKGICSAGEQTCNALGDGYGECLGESLPAVEDCSASDVDENCDGHECGIWGKAIPQIYLHAVTEVDGALLVAGTFFGSVTFAGEEHVASFPHTGFVAKVSASGDELWFVQMDRAIGAVRQVVPDVTGGAYLLAETPKGLVGAPHTQVLAVDAAGVERWWKEYDQPLFRRLVADATGVVLAGAVTAPVNLGDGEIQPVGEDALVARFDRDGGLTWKSVVSAASRFNDLMATPDGGYDCVGAAGDVAIIQHFKPDGEASQSGNGDFGASRVRAEALAIVGDSGGGRFIALSTTADFDEFEFDDTLGSEAQVFLARVYISGAPFRYQVDWVKDLRPFRAESTRLRLTASGDVIAYGEAEHSVDYVGQQIQSGNGLMMRISQADKQPSWQLQFGTPNGWVRSVAELPSGELVGVASSNAAGLTIGDLQVPNVAGYALFKTGK